MLRKLREAREEEGFTLIELLVVVIIIGILAAIAIPAFLGQRDRARRAAMQSDLRNLAVQAETYFTDEQTYVDFHTDPLWIDYDQSTGVNLFFDSANASGNAFCIQASHDDMAEVWSFDSTASPQLDEATCTGAAAAHPNN